MGCRNRKDQSNYLGFIIEKDREIIEDVIHKIKVGW